MDEIKEKTPAELFVRDTGELPVDGHDGWARKKIKAVLEAKRGGRASYKTLHEIAAR